MRSMLLYFLMHAESHTSTELLCAEHTGNTPGSPRHYSLFISQTAKFAWIMSFISPIEGGGD